MALSEDLSVFLTDFGVTCTSGATTALGILDMPGQILADGMVISTDYQLTAKAADFGSMKYNDSISVEGVAYTVRETRLIDDGRFCEVSLMKT
jgi:ABC-type transporter Mla maintaining outer membrane lipid asymmetry permease subunit MlaE